MLTNFLVGDPGVSDYFATEICPSKGQTGGAGCQLLHWGAVAAPRFSETPGELTEKFTNHHKEATNINERSVFSRLVNIAWSSCLEFVTTEPPLPPMKAEKTASKSLRSVV